MPRPSIPPGEVGRIAVVPLGYEIGDDERKEVTVPRPTTDVGDKLDYPKGTKAGQSIKVETLSGVREYVVTRWRGLARIVDPDPIRSANGEIVLTDGKPRHAPPIMIRRWAPTKAAAEEATKRAARNKLDDLERAREAQQAADEAVEAAERAAREAANAPDPTTVGELLIRWRTGLHDHSNRLHESTKDDYETVIRSLLGEPLRPLRGGRQRARSPERLAMSRAFEPVRMMRPADVDARALKDLLRSIADTNGKGTAIKVRSILAHVWDLAMEDRKLSVQINVVRALRGTESNPVIPNRTKRATALDPKHAPTDDEYRSLIDALASDPEAGPMVPGKRNKSAHGRAGKGEPNGKDIRDLVSLLFFTGARQGELLALRWSDVVLDGDDPHITIRATLTYTPGQPLRRTPTKTRGGSRNVYLVPQAVEMLRARAEHLEHLLVDANSDYPIFGSPQHPERLRDPNNLNRSIRILFNRHGVTWGRSHIGRKYVVNHLLRHNVPLPEVARVVGWSDVLTVSKYADTASEIGPGTRAAMDATPG